MRSERIKLIRKQEGLQDELDRCKKMLTETKTSYQKKMAALQKENNKVTSEMREVWFNVIYIFCYVYC